MPLTSFTCPDGGETLTKTCLTTCRMDTRCAPRSFLEQAAFDREWRGITASMAGNGVRQIYLKKIKDYARAPVDSTFAILGTGTHEKLARADFNRLVEENLPEGTADLLEDNEGLPGTYIVTDWKTWGSYKVALAQGIVKDKETKKFVRDESIIDLKTETFQLNSYRLGFERCGFTVSQLRIAAIVRDGNTYMAKNRGIMTSLVMIDVPILDDEEVRSYYMGLRVDLTLAENLKYAPICDRWEAWDYRRCDGYCEVADHCKQMSKDKDEPTWEDRKNEKSKSKTKST